MKYCCDDMKEKVEYQCDIHDSRFDCPDCLITYIPKHDKYLLIIHDGGSSGIRIDYCPWCGKKLPPSKSDLWYEVLERLGYEETDANVIPVEFLDETWYSSGKYSELIKEIEKSDKFRK